MFSFKHPRPLLSTRAVAMQVVARKEQAGLDTRLIVVEKPIPESAPLAAPERKAEQQT